MIKKVEVILKGSEADVEAKEKEIENISHSEEVVSLSIKESREIDLLSPANS